MSITPFRPHITLLLAVQALLFAGVAFSQDQSDSPPWARKPKSTADSNSKSSTTSTSTAVPTSVAEPGKIVQPTSSVPVDDSQGPAAQRGRIRVNVNRVNVLVSARDET